MTGGHAVTSRPSPNGPEVAIEDGTEAIPAPIRLRPRDHFWFTFGILLFVAAIVATGIGHSSGVAALLFSVLAGACFAVAALRRWPVGRPREASGVGEL